VSVRRGAGEAFGVLVVCGLLVAGLLSLARAQAGDPTPAEAAPAVDTAATAVAAQLQVERTLLEEGHARFRELGGRRAALHERLGSLYAELDRRIASTADEGLGAALDALLREIETAEAERGRLGQTERVLIEHIVQQSRRVSLLEQQLAEIEGRLELQDAGTLNGDWAVAMLPVEQQGTLTLRQSGTLVSGTYKLNGGFSGSLQGTLVSRKIYLVRIDSKLGKSMELEGYVSADGKTMRGTWLNFELAGSAGSSGQWVATKR